MDVKQMVENTWLTSTDVINSPTKTVVILDQGKVETATSLKGEEYQAVKVLVSMDETKKDWRLSKTALKKMVQAFGAETQLWVGKKVMLTTIPTQGGKTGIIPV